MAKEKFSGEKCLPICRLILRQVKSVHECLYPFSGDINSSFLQMERLRKSLENVHETISNFLMDFEIPRVIWECLIMILEELLLYAEYLSFSSIGGGYNISYDIYNTIRLQKSGEN